jgi:hypothetical protein
MASIGDYRGVVGMVGLCVVLFDSKKEEIAEGWTIFSRHASPKGISAPKLNFQYQKVLFNFLSLLDAMNDESYQYTQRQCEHGDDGWFCL